MGAGRDAADSERGPSSEGCNTPGAQPSSLDDAWLDKVVRQRNREMHDGLRRVAKKRLLPAYLRLREQHPDVLTAWGAPPGSPVDVAVVRLLRAKPRRTASGVATITVLTKPWPCAGDCIFCPNDVRMPKSYLADEPACQRAERCFFDPYLQVAARLRVLQDMGHVTDKVELIVLGGTWSDYPRAYQLWFMTELFCALNASAADRAATAEQRRAFYEECGLTSDARVLEQQVAPLQQQVSEGTLRYTDAWERLYAHSAPWQRVAAIQHATMAELAQQQRFNEHAHHRCVGLVVETRPELVTVAHAASLRQLGCTKVQMGIQTLDARTLSRCGRPTDPAQVQRAFALLRLFGFKSHIHMMANLPGATLASDAAEFRTLMRDARYLPDEVKLYPCALVESAHLTDLYASGQWVPYAEEDLIALLADDLMATPPHVRISRMIRDISSTDIIAGNKKTNLRQMVEARVRAAVDAGEGCCCEMRFREIATDRVNAADLRLETIAYDTTVSHERFLQWVNGAGRLVGFLRLSLPHAEAVERVRAAEGEAKVAADGAETVVAEAATDVEAVAKEAAETAPWQATFPIEPGQAMIREVHVYGKVAAIVQEGGHANAHSDACDGDGGQDDADGWSNSERQNDRAQNSMRNGAQASDGAAQHGGLGRKLVEEACRQAAAAGYRQINVISAVGTRAYYRSLGFRDAGLYQVKDLAPVAASADALL